jgi:hypothetical protein
VYSASSSNESEQDLPQKRRTLSSGFSQYQHAPLGGKARRVGTGVPVIDAATSGSTAAPLSGKLSCVVSKVTPLPATRNASMTLRLLQWNTARMMERKQH